MESIKKIFFLCDGNVPECKKTQCYKSGGECRWTSDIRHAINFENVSEYGTYYEIGHDIKLNYQESSEFAKNVASGVSQWYIDQGRHAEESIRVHIKTVKIICTITLLIQIVALILVLI